MKDTFYFQHDCNANSDEKILDLRSECGYEGYGIYWAILELLHQNDGKLQFNSKRLAFAIQVPEILFSKVVSDFNLFEFEDGYFYSKRLLEQIEYRKEIIQKRKISGALGGVAAASAKHLLSKNTPKERKGNIKESNKEKTNGHDFLNESGWQNDIETYNGILANYPKLFKMKRPLLFKEHDRLVKKWGIKMIRDVYRDMEAWSELMKKREWAAGVADKWAESELKKVKK